MLIKYICILHDHINPPDLLSMSLRPMPMHPNPMHHFRKTRLTAPQMPTWTPKILSHTLSLFFDKLTCISFKARTFPTKFKSVQTNRASDVTSRIQPTTAWGHNILPLWQMSRAQNTHPHPRKWPDGAQSVNRDHGHTHITVLSSNLRPIRQSPRDLWSYPNYKTRLIIVKIIDDQWNNTKARKITTNQLIIAHLFLIL